MSRSRFARRLDDRDFGLGAGCVDGWRGRGRLEGLGPRSRAGFAIDLPGSSPVEAGKPTIPRRSHRAAADE